MLGEARLPRGQWDSKGSFFLGSLGAVLERTTVARLGRSRLWKLDEVWVWSLPALDNLLSAWTLLGTVW